MSNCGNISRYSFRIGVGIGFGTKIKTNKTPKKRTELISPWFYLYLQGLTYGSTVGRLIMQKREDDEEFGCGAGDGIRTRDVLLGKQTPSYRICCRRPDSTIAWCLKNAVDCLPIRDCGLTGHGFVESTASRSVPCRRQTEGHFPLGSGRGVRNQKRTSSPRLQDSSFL